MYLAGAVVTSLSLTQEIAGSSPFTVMKNIFVSEMKHLRKTPIVPSCKDMKYFLKLITTQMNTCQNVVFSLLMKSYITSTNLSW